MDDVENFGKSSKNGLTKGEDANKFARAVIWGNRNEIKYASKSQQLLTDVCRRLIQKAIIAWNYLYMSN